MTSSGALLQAHQYGAYGNPKRRLERNAPTNFVQSDIPKVQAYDGPLPEGKQGFEFTTSTTPDPGGIPGQPTWSGNGYNPDVQTIGDKAVIPCDVTKTQC